MKKNSKYLLLPIGLVVSFLIGCSSSQEFEAPQYVREISSPPVQEATLPEIDLQVEKDEIEKEYRELVSADSVDFSNSMDILNGKKVPRDECEEMLYHLRKDIKAAQYLVDVGIDGHSESVERGKSLEKRILRYQQLKSNNQ